MARTLDDVVEYTIKDNLDYAERMRKEAAQHTELAQKRIAEAEDAEKEVRNIRKGYEVFKEANANSAISSNS